MVRRMITCVTLAVSSLAFGADIFTQHITLPKQEELKQRINGMKLPPEFDEKTALSDNLTNHAAYAMDVVIHVTMAIEKYNDIINTASTIKPDKKLEFVAWMEKQKTPLIEAVLQDQPALIAQLKEKKIIE
jgi:hypothetical protein